MRASFANFHTKIQHELRNSLLMIMKLDCVYSIFNTNMYQFFIMHYTMHSANDSVLGIFPVLLVGKFGIDSDRDIVCWGGWVVLKA